jgi:hypothetical protein
MCEIYIKGIVYKKNVGGKVVKQILGLGSAYIHAQH